MQNRTISFQTTNIIGGDRNAIVSTIKLPEPARIDLLSLFLLVSSETV